MPRRFYVEHPFQEPGIYIADADTTALIAKLYEANPLEVELGRSLTTEQNAKLLAAAPELLEACKTLLGFFEENIQEIRGGLLRERLDLLVKTQTLIKATESE